MRAATSPSAHTASNASSVSLSCAGAGKGNVRDLEQHRIVGRIEDAARADRHAADRVAVIAVLEREDAVARLAAIVPVAERHLERDLDRGGAAVGEEDMRKSGRRDRDEAARQLLGGSVREAGENHLVESVGLRR